MRRRSWLALAGGNSSRHSFAFLPYFARSCPILADGLRTVRVAEIALSHSVGALPEPEQTHKFC